MSSRKIEITVGFSSILFGECFRKSTIERGKNLVSANHISHVKETVEGGKPRIIEGRCIPQTKINDMPYLMSITLDENRKIVGFACNCTAGAGDGSRSCKHVCALAIFINQEREESKTDSACSWSAPSQRAKEEYGTKGKPLTKIFNLPGPEFSHDWSKSPSEEQREKYAKLMKKHKIHDSNLYKICKVKVLYFVCN